jgi:hypothetical protein
MAWTERVASPDELQGGARSVVSAAPAARELWKAAGRRRCLPVKPVLLTSAREMMRSACLRLDFCRLVLPGRSSLGLLVQLAFSQPRGDPQLRKRPCSRLPTPAWSSWLPTGVSPRLLGRTRPPA